MLNSLMMASAGTQEEAHEAQSMGWRTFRILTPDQKPSPAETMCLNVRRGTACQVCGLCGGTSKKAKHVAMPLYGSKQVHFYRNVEDGRAGSRPFLGTETAQSALNDTRITGDDGLHGEAVRAVWFADCCRLLPPARASLVPPALVTVLAKDYVGDPYGRLIVGVSGQGPTYRMRPQGTT